MTIDRSTLSPQKILENYIYPRIAFEPNTGCWIWEGYIRRDGYVTVALPKDKTGWSTTYVARYLYEIIREKIHDGFVVRNQCKMVGCINPDHYRAITKDESARSKRPWKKRVVNRAKCARGHFLTDENAFRDSLGTRRCRICKQINEQKCREKKRAEDWRKFGDFIESTEYLDHTSKHPKKYYVYHLIDPLTERVFYVGKGSGGRVLQHEKGLLAGALSVNSKKETKIRAIWAAGGEVQFSIVHRNLSEAHALWMEQQEIGRIGVHNLTNRSSVAIPKKYQKQIYA